MIFPEGHSNNGKCMMNLKRGAFSANVAMYPCTSIAPGKAVTPTYGSVRGLEIGFLATSEFALIPMDLTKYPVFVPNEYLYTEYAKTIPGYESMKKWQIYAHAIRDFLCRESGLEKTNRTMREGFDYRKLMFGQIEEVEVDGKIVKWPVGGECTITEKKKTD